MKDFFYLALAIVGGLIWGAICYHLEQISLPTCSDRRRFSAIHLYLYPSIVFFLVFSQHLITATELLCLITGFSLSIADWHNKSYPLSTWLIGFIPACFLTWPSWLTVFLLFLACLSQVRLIPMGAGDFLYLASISLVFNLQQLLWVIQIASLSGILFFILRKRQGSLPFIPFLYLSFLFLFIIQKAADS